MVFLLSTAFIVIGMGWFAFAGLAHATAGRSLLWARCLASLLVIAGMVSLSWHPLSLWS